MQIGPHLLWAKIDHDKTGTPISWHSLIAHSIDVAAVFETLLENSATRIRLAKIAKLPDIPPIMRKRFTALTMVHDAGKANHGFRARADVAAPRVGHINELAWVFSDQNAAPILERLIANLALDKADAWFSGETAFEFITAIYAHHGKTWKQDVQLQSILWEPKGKDDPVDRLKELGAAITSLFPEAFEPAGSKIPASNHLVHAYAGLLMLADWIGSDTNWFPHANGAEAADLIGYYENSKATARRALTAIGIDVESANTNPIILNVAFGDLFKISGVDMVEPRPIQAEARAVTSPLIVVESETGSGKTEAALWHAAGLLKEGLVDGVYFALPTRVAATQIFGRVKKYRDNLFDGQKPAVVLAVPGQIRADDSEGISLPGFKVQWKDDNDDDARWAAEHPKRYLAAKLAVGTIDQALLGVIITKHAHMRRTALLRHLLIVDEVHASDPYMEVLLSELLKVHIAAGGRAVLLSATLGSRMRSRLLGTPAETINEAKRIPYPRISWAENRTLKGIDVPGTGRTKKVAVETKAWIDDPNSIAIVARNAVEDGGKVLIIRNTVSAAIETQRYIEHYLASDSRLFFRVGGVGTLHHGRFAVSDRRLLDSRVEEVIGRDRPDGGLVVVGTQTLEQSLDIDADLIITDLCPIDVLLQRIGRLHRHERTRLSTFAIPKALVLVPRNGLEANLGNKGRNGLGIMGSGGGIYDDLRILELTRRLIHTYPTWSIPEMNRMLVEEATHPDRLDSLVAELEPFEQKWAEHATQVDGIRYSRRGAAKAGIIDWDKPISELQMDDDGVFGTRLGAKNFQVEITPPMSGPFGEPVDAIVIPSHMLPSDIGDGKPSAINSIDGGFQFSLGDVRYQYDRFGLQRL